MQGKLIALYGINNLGKTTQAKLLAEKLISAGRRSKLIKVPQYSIEPSGPIINNYLRGGNPYNLSPREAQIFGAFNRSQLEPALKADLEDGIDVVLEDYWATGIGWGAAAGVDISFLKKINGYCVQEDIAFLFSGKRFMTSIESSHVHEINNELSQKADEVFHELAREHAWHIIHANDSIETISGNIWSKVQEIL